MNFKNMVTVKDVVNYYLAGQAEKILNEHSHGEAFEIEDVKKLLFAEIKQFDYEFQQKLSLKKRQKYMFEFTNLIELLTPKEFSQVIPIKKDFKGYKTEIRDYFSTVEFIESIGWNNKIKNGFEFLMNYWADETFLLSVFMMETVSDFKQRESGKPIFQTFLEEQGIELHTPDDFKNE
ncbi:hypothetical protein [Liquorilactobacillus hordei]|uniref:hypothetical protein n=1 Tax=Liquorilactobacillus hordei TaxID=468911 RepID=UPI0039EBF636